MKSSHDRGEVFTPYWLVREMLQTVPNSIFEGNVLDPTCGSGRFIIEVIKRKLICGLSKKKAVETTYGVELDKNNVLRCRKKVRNLVGDKYGKLIDKNIVQADALSWDFHSWGKSKKPFEESKSLTKHLWKQSSWSLIVGNPPYHINNGGSRNTLYPKFTSLALSLQPSVLLWLIPNKWISQPKLEYIKTALMPRIETMQLYKVQDVWPTLTMVGNVVWFKWVAEKTTSTELHLGEFSWLHNLIKKYPKIRVLGRNAFALASNTKHDHSGKIKCFTSKGDILVNNVLKNKSLVNQWLVVGGVANGYRPNIKNNNYYLIPPGTVCSEAYVVLFSSKEEHKARNFLAYTKTSFFQYCLWAGIENFIRDRAAYRFVPYVDQNKKWTDKKLFKIFNFTQDQQKLVLNYFKKDKQQ